MKWLYSLQKIIQHYGLVFLVCAAMMLYGFYLYQNNNSSDTNLMQGIGIEVIGNALNLLLVTLWWDTTVGRKRENEGERFEARCEAQLQQVQTQFDELKVTVQFIAQQLPITTAQTTSRELESTSLEYAPPMDNHSSSHILYV